VPVRFLFYLKISALGNDLHIIFFVFFLCAVDDTSDGAFVQRRGRFKVTSADLSPMVCIKWQIFLFTYCLLLSIMKISFVEISKAVLLTLYYWVKVVWDPLNHLGGNFLINIILWDRHEIHLTLKSLCKGLLHYWHFSSVYGKSSNGAIVCLSYASY